MEETRQAFTLIEIIVAMVIVTVVATFAIPQYAKTMEQAFERDAIQQLTSLHSIEQVYEAKTNDYWPSSGSSINDLDTINSNLKLSIMANGFDYNCENQAPNATCSATRSAGTYKISIRHDLPISDTNPYCSAGSCPTLQ